MAQHKLFSTGTLSASRSHLPGPESMSRETFGTSVPAATNAIGNVSDGDTSTQADFRVNFTSGGYHVLRIDLGESKSVARVELRNVSITGATTEIIACYVSDAAYAVDATKQLGSTVTVTAPQTVTEISGSAKSGRYVYIGRTGTIADAVVYIGEVTVVEDAAVEFATLQEIALEEKTDAKLLYGPAWVNRYPEDVAFFNRRAEFRAKSALIDPAALFLATGATQGSRTIGANTHTSLQGKKTIALPKMSALFEGRSVDGKKVFWRLPHVRLPGVMIPYQLGDFAMPNLRGLAYPNGVGEVFYIDLED